MSVDKIINSLGSLRIDPTVTLANLNVDFSLFKVEALPEYAPLGKALSLNRRTNAEDGSQHFTARKLGALFETTLPHTPDLFKVYGTRASQISSDETWNPRGTASDGSFADHVGADGTSIWAAATSGGNAIAVHLLACMIARMCSGPHAVAVWMELIEERKNDIQLAQERGDPVHVQSMIAAKQVLDREQLRRWDASARAWLLTADQVQSKRQSQLMSILKRTSISVNGSTEVHQSVMEAWKTALTAINNLILGMPQQVSDGAVLLGLASWHLYPNLIVLGERIEDELLNDPLIAPGGNLTIGMLPTFEGEKTKGVTWSLSLAHYRFYGEPVLSESSISNESSRISFEYFMSAVLGSVLSSWYGAEDDFESTIEWFPVCWNCIASSENEQSDELASGPDTSNNPPYGKYLADYPAVLLHTEGWFGLLYKAARNVLASVGNDRKDHMSLFKYGWRNGVNFLESGKVSVPSMFELSVPSNLIALIRKEQRKVAYLRELAARLKLQSNTVVIRYVNTPPQGEPRLEYTTAVPIATKTPASCGPSQRHTRWIGQPSCACTGKCDTTVCPCKRAHLECTRSCHSHHAQQLQCTRLMSPAHFDEYKQELRNLNVMFQRLEEDTERFSESRIEITNNGLSEHGFRWKDAPAVFRQPQLQGTEISVHFKLLWGDPYGTALFVRHDAWNREEIDRAKKLRLGVKEVKDFLLDKALHPGQLANFLMTRGILSSFKVDYYQSLMALSSAALIYAQIPEAMVSLRSILGTLHRAAWAPERQRCNRRSVRFPSYEPCVLDRPSTFACIIYFETGRWNPSPKDLAKVMAMSSGNSIYISQPILSDPWTRHRGNRIKRIIGNIGRAGIALLMPPGNLRVRPPSADEWKLVNHAAFDGTREDYFNKTSLHLGFTGYETPVNIGLNGLGLQDTEVYLLEATVSAYDGGKWVADLDILGSLGNSQLITRHIADNCTCSHSKQSASPDIPKSLSQSTTRLTAIDNWSELLDYPTKTGVVRANNNWIGRLATAVVAVQKGHIVHIVDSSACWRCLHVGDILKLPYMAEKKRGRRNRNGVPTIMIF